MGEISEIGIKMLQMQDTLAKKYKYKLLPPNIGFAAMATYLKYLPEEFNDSTSYLNIGAYVKGKKSCIYTINDTLISEKYERIVIGHYGAFIEIADEDMNKLFVKIKEGQEYRINDPEYEKHVKYYWYTMNDGSDCKLYYQKKGVTYADYKPGFWYISPYEVLFK